LVGGSFHARGSAGFVPCVSVGRCSFPDIVAAPSIATTSALPPGSARCNTAAPPAADENAAHSLSAGIAAFAADVAGAFGGQPLDFRDDV
jgi:hypothetical protein